MPSSGAPEITGATEGGSSEATVTVVPITITKNARRRGFTFTRIDGTPITAQRPDEYSRPSVPGTDMRPHAEHALLERLTVDVARGEPPANPDRIVSMKVAADA